MTEAMVKPEGKGARSAPLESALRARIAGLSYLPTSAAVAVKFIELGRDPDTGPNEYARVIASDASLAGKLLALANSSWFGVRQKVTRVPMAVSLLGICNVRALALSHCMTGLHHELGLKREESATYWEAGLCKAVAARRYVQTRDDSLAEVAFAAGIFQDFALTVMHAVDKGQTLQTLTNPNLSPEERQEEEQRRFGMTHGEAGRLLAQNLALPDPYIDTTAFHHDTENLERYVESDALAEGVYLAGFLPHVRTTWHPQDIRQAQEVFGARLEQLFGGWDAYLADVQRELNELFAYFQQGKTPELKLPEMVVAASREIADATAALVGTSARSSRPPASPCRCFRRRSKPMPRRATCSILLPARSTRRAFASGPAPFSTARNAIAARSRLRSCASTAWRLFVRHRAHPSPNMCSARRRRV